MNIGANVLTPTGRPGIVVRLLRHYQNGQERSEPLVVVRVGVGDTGAHEFTYRLEDVRPKE